MDFSQVPVEALEALRLRLTQITHSLNKLHAELQTHQQLTTHWVSLQSQFNIILTQLTALSSTLLNYSEILERTTVYPISEFPTTEQEGLLTTLLRKKKLPEVIDWIDESKENIESVIKNLDSKDDEELTTWALQLIQQEKQKYTFVGLKETDQDEIIQADEIQPTLSIDNVLKLIYQGTLPDTLT